MQLYYAKFYSILIYHMKKFNTIVALLFLMIINAQTFKYGVTGNFHQGSIVGVHDRSEGKFGGGVGIFGQWSLVENDIFDSAWLYVMPQLEYSMQGETADANEAKFDKQRFTHDYIAAQVYLKYFFHKGNMKRDFFVFGGPRVEFLIREKREVPAGYDDAYYYLNKDDKVNNIGYGASVGAGLQVSPKIEAFLRYDRGFSKVYTNNDRNHTVNHLLAVGINYYLNENWW